MFLISTPVFREKNTFSFGAIWDLFYKQLYKQLYIPVAQPYSLLFVAIRCYSSLFVAIRRYSSLFVANRRYSYNHPNRYSSLFAAICRSTR